MAIIDRIKYDGPGYECENCRIDAREGETRCPRCGKPFVVRPWLAYKFPSESLVLGSQLIVNNAQEAVFFKGGRALDVFGPGTHTLSTGNLPILKSIVNLPFGGKTPFSAEIYFVNRAAKLDMKWGTPDPFQVTDPRYHVIARVRSFGQMGIRLQDSRLFITQIMGVLPVGQASDYQAVERYFVGVVVSKVKATIGEMIVSKRVSVLDLVASLDLLSGACMERIAGEFARFGIELVNFFIESINVPEEDLARLRTTLQERAEFDILGDERYTRKRSFDVLEKGMENETVGGSIGSAMGLGLGLGAGVGMGGTMYDLAQNIQVRRGTGQNPGQVACGKCGNLVVQGSKFCSHCGEKLVPIGLTCPGCHFQNAAEARFCVNCGTPLKPRQCPGCGTSCQPGARFCPNCGTPISG